MAKGHSRGWCESPIEEVVRRLQGLQHRMTVKPTDQAPFRGMLYLLRSWLMNSLNSNTTGELKILIYSPGDTLVDNKPSAALRLKESDDDSCLWHLRSNEEGLRSSIKSLMTDS